MSGPSASPELTLAPSASGSLDSATSSGGLASAGSGCLPLSGRQEAGRSSSFVFRSAGSGVMALDFAAEPRRSESLKFFGDMSAADLLDDSQLAERHRRVQAQVDDLSPVSDAGEVEPGVVQQAVELAAAGSK